MLSNMHAFSATDISNTLFSFALLGAGGGGYTVQSTPVAPSPSVLERVGGAALGALRSRAPPPPTSCSKLPALLSCSRPSSPLPFAPSFGHRPIVAVLRRGARVGDLLAQN